MKTDNEKMVAWVKYECGCCEGIWVSDKGFCRHHNKRVIKTSDEVSISVPDEILL